MSFDNVNSCAICLNDYDDANLACYIVCNNGHHCCLVCYNGLKLRGKCHECRHNLLTTPIKNRLILTNSTINNSFTSGTVTETASTMTTERPITDIGIFNKEYVTNKKIVFLLDTSHSMNTSSHSTDKNAPKRIEIVGHMAKYLFMYCKILNKECVFYEFNSYTTKMPIHIGLSNEEAFKNIEKLESGGNTMIAEAMYKAFLDNNNAIYIVLTDGEPSSSESKLNEVLTMFENLSLHFILFGNGANAHILNLFAQNKPNHTISYIENLISLMAYSIPVFVQAITENFSKELSPLEEELRNNYINILAPQIHGSSNKYKLQNLIDLLKSDKFKDLQYAKDLLIDTIDDTNAHGRISHSFTSEHWTTFGKYYLKCILHCHKYKQVCNNFDVSLNHYKSDAFNNIKFALESLSTEIKYVAFTTKNEYERKQQEELAKKKVKQSVEYSQTYSYSSSCDDSGSSENDACIGQNELITTVDGYKLMKDLKIGDKLSTGTVKWIIEISNLNNNCDFNLYNGMTASHPVYENNKWVPASQQSNPTITTNKHNDVVYDIVLEERNVSHILVNNVKSAVVGYAIPSMEHPYWGNYKIIEDLQRRCPDGGMIKVDANKFSYINGLVSNIFDN